MDEEATQIKSVFLTATDDNRPLKLKRVFVKIYIPANENTSANYSVTGFPFGLVEFDAEGFGKGSNGYKLNNHGFTANYNQKNYSSFESWFEGTERVSGESTANASTSDGYATKRGWLNSPGKLENLWGEIVKERLINSVRVYISTENVYFPDGTKIEIFGVEGE